MMNLLNLNDMTNEDLKKLAEQYADKECAMSKHKGKSLRQLHEDKIIEFYDVFGFLIEKFCIVEKEKARELARLTLEHGGSDDFGLIYELVDWVCDNFDEEYRKEAEK